jgi:hypothetical protein
MGAGAVGLMARLLVGVVALVGVSAAWSQGCSLINRGASEVRDAAGAAVDLPAPRLQRCDGLRVSKGTVVACTVTARGRSVCKTYSAGQTVAEAELGRGQEGNGPWYTLGDILQGSPGRVTLVSRGRELRSLPTGAVVLLQPVAIEPDFDADAALRGTQGIDIHRGGPDGRKVATLSARRTPKLETAMLEPGQRYSWRINPAPGGLPAIGEFTLLTEPERRMARQEAERVRKEARGDAAAQAVMWAGWLASRGCGHEAAKVLSEAGFGVD